MFEVGQLVRIDERFMCEILGSILSIKEHNENTMGVIISTHGNYSHVRIMTELYDEDHFLDFHDLLPVIRHEIFLMSNKYIRSV